MTQQTLEQALEEVKILEDSFEGDVRNLLAHAMGNPNEYALALDTVKRLNSIYMSSEWYSARYRTQRALGIETADREKPIALWTKELTEKLKCANSETREEAVADAAKLWELTGSKNAKKVRDCSSP